MPKTIFEFASSQNIVAYWEEKKVGLPPYLGVELFPDDKKLGLKLDWIKGSKGLPIVLKPSSYDAKAKKRPRIGFDKLSAHMPFFKESNGIDEETRQQLNMVLETGNQAYIDSVMKKVFDDDIQLINGAAAQRERMRMMALTTGAISISANGQDYDYDYGMPNTHKVTVGTSWSNAAADIIKDIEDGMDLIEEDTGVRPERAVCSQKTWGYFRKNTAIRNAILGNNSGAPVTDGQIHAYILDNYKLDIIKYTKKCKLENGTVSPFVADDIFVMFPSGNLGTGWFGTTPEESDLMSGSNANVSLTDTGVAVTTSKTVDPVSVDTKVSMIYLPSFEAADQVYILDVIA